MRVIEQVEMLMEWADVHRRIRHPLPVSHLRSPGVHLSGVLRYIAQESGILAKPSPPPPPSPSPSSPPGVDSTSFPDMDEDIMPLRMMLGMFFEEGAVGLYPDMQWQPGELERDGVFGTCDGLSVTPAHGLLLEEFKLTWKSEWNYGKDRFTSANWLWMSQAKGYLALMQANGIDIAPMVRFHVCWVAGDYRPPSPKLMRYVVEYTQKEIDSLWGLVLRNKNKPGVKKEI